MQIFKKVFLGLILIISPILKSQNIYNWQGYGNGTEYGLYYDVNSNGVQLPSFLITGETKFKTFQDTLIFEALNSSHNYNLLNPTNVITSNDSGMVFKLPIDSLSKKVDFNLLKNKPSFLSTSRTITINGNTQDLSANRTWNVGDILSMKD